MGKTFAAMLLTSLLITDQAVFGVQDGSESNGGRASAIAVPTAASQAASQPTANQDAQPSHRDSEKGWLAMGAEADAQTAATSQESTVGRSADKEPSEKSTEELAKAAQNPVADLISVPLQSNFNFFDIDRKLGPQDLHRNTMGYLLNVQPVIPIKLNDDWNVITRTIVPIINQPELFPGMGSHGGLGDTQFTPFLSPAKAGKLIWGVGPVLVFPTATDQWLGSGKFSAGPSAVVLKMDGPWVYGAIAQNLWSYAGDPDRDYVNQMLIQPFVNYNMPKGWYLTSSPIITADWHADSDQRWTVPLGGGVGRLFRIGKLPVNMQLQSFYNVVHPDFGPEWSVRFQLQFLFPK